MSVSFKVESQYANDDCCCKIGIWWQILGLEKLRLLKTNWIRIAGHRIYIERKHVWKNEKIHFWFRFVFV